MSSSELRLLQRAPQVWPAGELNVHLVIGFLKFSLGSH